MGGANRDMSQTTDNQETEVIQTTMWPKEVSGLMSCPDFRG